MFRVSKDGTGFTTLHTFPFNVTEGGYPDTPLVTSGDALYGLIGGSAPDTVFAINTDGTGYKTILQFSNPFEVGSDQRLALVADNVLYGTASLGGKIGSDPGSGRGNVFKLNTDGTGFTILHTFSGSGEGIRPMGGLVLSGNTLYGMTLGTATTLGTIFKVNVDGTGFTTVHTFPAYSTNGSAGTLVLSGGVLYGTNPYGGTEQGNNDGTVFKLNTDGTGYIDLYRFNGLVPRELVLSGGVLYGTLSGKDASGGSIVKLYRLSTDGTGFSVFYTFGELPSHELAVSGNSLYGTTQFGGGTVFAITLPPPALVISPSGPSVVLKWPNTANLTLQGSTNPAASDSWTPLPITPVVVDGQNTVWVPASDIHHFFRLSQ